MVQFALSLLGIAAITILIISIIVSGRNYIKKLEEETKNQQND